MQNTKKKLSIIPKKGVVWWSILFNAFDTSTTISNIHMAVLVKKIRATRLVLGISTTSNKKNLCFIEAAMKPAIRPH